MDSILACALPEGDRLFFDALTNDGTRWYIHEKRVANDWRLAETRDLRARALVGVLSITTLAPVETARALAEELRARFEHSRLIVFGDAENDLDMFQQADLRVAVRNAVPELLALADHVVESNDDGVVRWLVERHPPAARPRP